MKLSQQKNFQELCLVCDNHHSHLFQVAQCEHKFCINCSIAYIDSQANHFSNARCLQEGCGQPLDKTLPIYTKLDITTQRKLKQFEIFQFLQKNTNYRSCKKRDCSGVFPLTDGKCNVCSTKHCRQCANLTHQGKCVQTKQQTQMKNLNYRQCPNCRVWVQKVEGCRYIKCKCSIEFCYSCGTEFSKDPCRKGEIWQKQAQIRSILFKFHQNTPKQAKNWFNILPKILLFVFLILPLTIILCPLLMALSVSGLMLIISIFVPFVLCHAISKIQSKFWKYMSGIAFIVIYPIMVGICALICFLILLLFPFCRNCNHHGIYDPFDTIISSVALYYLKFLECVLLGS